MDWSKVRTPASRSEPPPPRLLEMCWRVKGPSGRVIICGVYEMTTSSLEVRAGYSIDELLGSQLTRDLTGVRLIASAWLAAMRAEGGFDELPESQA